MFELGLIKLNQAPFSKGWLINPHKELIKQTKLKDREGCIGKSYHDRQTNDQVLQKKFKPLVESMEGAALHYICLMEKIPFLQIRGISNYIGERNKKKWNMKDAINNLNNELDKNN